MIKHEAIKNTLLVYLLLFASGSLLFRQNPHQLIIVLLFVSVLAWYFFSDRKIDTTFVLYVTVFTGFLLTISLYTGGSLSLPSVIAATIKLVFAYLILKTVGESFPGRYVAIIVFLAFVSIFGTLSDQFHLLDGLIYMLPRIGTGEGYMYHEGIIFAFRAGMGGSNYARNGGIFFEPGAYQGFLNAGIFMLLFAQGGLSPTRRWVYMLILVVALYMTTSTTGYLIFAALLGLYLLKGKTLSVSGKVGLVSALSVAVLVFYAEFNHVIFEKIEHYTSIQDITDSGDRRSFDALVDLEVFKKNWFGLGYDDYFKEFGKIGVVSDVYGGSSNGITKTLAVYGLPFAIFLFGSYYWGLVRIVGFGIASIVSFVMLLMFFVGEAYYIMEPAPLALIAAGFVYGRSQSPRQPTPILGESA